MCKGSYLRGSELLTVLSHEFLVSEVGLAIFSFGFCTSLLFGTVHIVRLEHQARLLDDFRVSNWFYFLFLNSLFDSGFCYGYIQYFLGYDGTRV